MADIAFLLLIFFLVTTTMDVDTGIARKLPPIPEEGPTPPSQINQRNYLNIQVNREDQLMVNGEIIAIDDLKSKTKNFLANPLKSNKLAESPAKAIVSISNNRNTSYERYIEVQNEIAAAYNELRNEFSMAKYGVSFYELEKQSEAYKTVRKKYPLRISEAEPNLAQN